ncbi:MAG: CBS domain-containing protein [Staphylothermus sp.]|nr:CBS domain-containing protein [Staphylothermus sp.]
MSRRPPIRPSIGAPRRIEKHRWLRSDGTPNFDDRIYKTTEEMEIVAKRPVAQTSPQTPILEAIEEMAKGYRSLVVTVSGKLAGLLLSTHIVNYLGGGEYFNIVKERYNYNIYSALEKEPVSTIMEKDPIVGYMDEKLYQILEKMVMNEIGIVPILLRDGRVYGIITEHDLIKYLSTGVRIGVKVSEVMTSPVVTVSSGDPLKKAMETMIKYGFRRVSVTSDNVVLGIITAMDIVKYFGTHEAFKRTTSGDIREAISIPVDDIMVRELLVVKPDEDLGDVAQKMANKNVGSALVVNDKMELLGIITERDILYALATKR